MSIQSQSYSNMLEQGYARVMYTRPPVAYAPIYMGAIISHDYSSHGRLVYFLSMPLGSARDCVDFYLPDVFYPGMKRLVSLYGQGLSEAVFSEEDPVNMFEGAACELQELEFAKTADNREIHNKILSVGQFAREERMLFLPAFLLRHSPCPATSIAASTLMRCGPY